MMKNHVKFINGTRFVFVQNGFLDGVNFGGNCKYFAVIFIARMLINPPLIYFSRPKHILYSKYQCLYKLIVKL